MNSPDFYDVLELSPSAQPEEIEGAYLRLAKAHGVEGGSNPRLALLRLAHSTLSDPTQRAAYDLARRPPPPPASAVVATTAHEAPVSQQAAPAASIASNPTSDSLGIAIMFAALFIVMKVLETVFTFVSNNFWPLVGLVAVVAVILLLSRKNANGVAVAPTPVQPAVSDASPTLERSHERNIPIQPVENDVDGGDLFALPHRDGNVVTLLPPVATQEVVPNTASAATGDTLHRLPDHLEDDVAVAPPSDSTPPVSEAAPLASQASPSTRSPVLVAAVAVLVIATALLALVSNSAASARAIAESRVRELETQLAQQEIKLQTAVEERNSREGELEETRNRLKMVLSSVPARQIRVTNGCFEQVSLVIRYLQSSGEWRNVGWWTLPPGQSSFMSEDGQQRLRTPITFYYYAEGARYRWEGQNETSFQNRTVKMLTHTNIDADGDYNVHLTCN